MNTDLDDKEDGNPYARIWGIWQDLELISVVVTSSQTRPQTPLHYDVPRYRAASSRSLPQSSKCASFVKDAVTYFKVERGVSAVLPSRLLVVPNWMMGIIRVGITHFHSSLSSLQHASAGLDTIILQSTRHWDCWYMAWFSSPSFGSLYWLWA